MNRKILYVIGFAWTIFAIFIILQLFKASKDSDKAVPPINNIEVGITPNITPMPPEDTITVTPIPEDNIIPTSANYRCPESGWVDCMPGPDRSEEQKLKCSQDYINWAQANCSNFEGVAY